MQKNVTRMAVLVFATSFSGALAQEQPDPLQHYVFFGRDRERINEPSFLDSPVFAGAQLKYTWKELEPEKDKYDTDLIVGDLQILQAKGKKLFIQLQDISFSTQIVNVPDYLREDPQYNGGAHIQYEVQDEQDKSVTPIGWVARRWDPAVLERVSKLLQALGKELDGKIEGINFAETSVGFGHTGEYFPEGFTFETYRDGIRRMMKAGRDAFPNSTVIVYANFMPGEWLPWTDHGYLKSIYQYAGQIGVGVGGPDLMPYRKGQLAHSYPLIRSRPKGLPAGIAVQWGNYDQLVPDTHQRITVHEIHRFGRDELRLDYIFWCTQEPSFSKDVIPYLNRITAGRQP